MEISKTTGIPLSEELTNIVDLPHTISFAIIYRTKINSFYEIPKEKQPPRNLWDKPYQLSEYLDEVFNSKESGGTENKTFIEYDFEEVE